MVEITPMGPAWRESADHLVGVATQLAAMGDREGAHAKFAQALAINPNHVGALVNYGASILADNRKPGGNGPGTAEAMAMTRRAQEIGVLAGRERAVLLNNIAYEMLTRREFWKAIDIFMDALMEDDGYSQAWNSLATCWANLGKWDDARRCYKRAAKRAPDQPEPKFNLGILALIEGRWDEGFPLYEHRPLRSPQEKYPFPCPRWKGEDPKGKRILVYPDQGLGDTVNFNRLVGEVARRGARVFLATVDEMRPVLPDLAGVEFIPRQALLEDLDYHVPLMSLPYCLRLTPDTVPPPVGLLVDGKLLCGLGPCSYTPPLTVGFCSAGNPTHGYDDLRSIPKEVMRSALSGVDGVELNDLNRDSKTEKFGDDLTGLVRAVWHMDLVVTVDTLVAHVAGELGIPVWNLIACGGVQDWRWLLGRDDTVWYPSMKLYRCEELGEWGDVLKRVRKDLQVWTD